VAAILMIQKINVTAGTLVTRSRVSSIMIVFLSVEGVAGTRNASNRTDRNTAPVISSVQSAAGVKHDGIDRGSKRSASL
jgi:hypothetical protein